ncbi:MAG: hypothetical protein ACREAA_09285 [Candidatus Polarisedimenticolia bacterium]
MGTPPERFPRYNHLLEVMDGAASLAMAIRQAESALMDPSLGTDDRTVLELALEASRDRFEHVVNMLGRAEDEAVEMGLAFQGTVVDLSHEELADAADAAEQGSTTGEHAAVRAIDRLGRSLDTGARAVLEGFLSHPSPLLRAGAMKVLVLHWRFREYADPVCWALVSDEDVDCRRAAALCLASLFQGTRDGAIGAELVAALSRAGEDESVQWACYHALLALEGREGTVSPRTIGRFSEEDADPGLLARYRRPTPHVSS